MYWPTTWPASTDGFHRQLLIQQGSLGQAVHRNDGTRTTYIGDLPTGVVAQELFVDTSQGSLVDTGHSLDFALEGGVLCGPNSPGPALHPLWSLHPYWRVAGYQARLPGPKEQGIFTWNGYLPGEHRGEITQGDDLVAACRLCVFPLGLAAGGSWPLCHRCPRTVTWAQDYMVVQGSLEQTNVSVIEEMVKMISAVRAMRRPSG